MERACFRFGRDGRRSPKLTSRSARRSKQLPLRCPERSAVRVEAPARFAAEPPGGHVVSEDRSGAIFAVAELAMKPLDRAQARIEADLVRHAEGAHLRFTQSHCGVDVFE